MSGECVDQSCPVARAVAVCAPPRAWGERYRHVADVPLFRSTPTSVGRTFQRHLLLQRRGEHPHERGADATASARRCSSVGAPPRAWGGHRASGGLCGTGRSTPTSVGRTTSPITEYSRMPEHPHERGADSPSVCRNGIMSGAPPRAWGGPPRTRRGGRGGRSTPRAWGGLRKHVHEWWSSAEHPHERGADRAPQPVVVGEHGAPPRAWGGRNCSARPTADLRSTPTSVGRTRPGSSASASNTEHPHERGADRRPASSARIAAGAPPRAWGGRMASCRTATTTTEHPHERGADPGRTHGLLGGGGAPPRAWSGHQWRPLPRSRRRSTPTSVGRTNQISGPGQPLTEHPHERGAD